MKKEKVKIVSSMSLPELSKEGTLTSTSPRDDLSAFLLDRDCSQTGGNIKAGRMRYR